MADTRKIVFKKEYESTIETLWYLINDGWSVTSAAYNAKMEQFKIILSEEHWPEIKIACSSCKTKLPPVHLMFRPFPSDVHLCIACNQWAK